MRSALHECGASPSVFVLDENQELEARAIIATYHAAASLTSPPGARWRCPCGEEIEPQFSACWSCGSEHAVENG